MKNIWLSNYQKAESRVILNKDDVTGRIGGRERAIGANNPVALFVYKEVENGKRDNTIRHS